MPSKLKELTVEKVAFVPEGDNKGANVLLFKGKEAQPPRQTPEESQEGTLKRMLLAIGKALGLDGGGEEPLNAAPGHSPQRAADASAAKPAQEAAPTLKGVCKVNIDKSKLTPEEVAALEAIEKKAGVPDTPPAEKPPAPAAKSIQEPAAVPGATSVEGEDVYKGLHPAIRAELERLRKQADAAEERELMDIAKKYEIIGKKAEELVPTLKSLKAAGGEAYQQMLAVLDASVAAVEKSGLFREVGKSGAAGAGDGGAWGRIEKHAEAIQKAAPELDWHTAVEKACEQHPDLVHEYESGR